ncbi:MAG: sensor histidine kinase [Myxococcota bacterium]
MPIVEPLAVLYVDDEATNLRVFEANFRARFKVMTCTSAQEALAMLSTQASEIGVLIADQRMPGMTGVELLEKVRESSPDVSRMIITAYSDLQAVMDAVNRGQVVRYFIKPWVREELGAALEDALRICALQTRLREIEVRMLLSERLATIGQVSAGIAHELMNPVAYMTQNIGALREELDLLERYVRPFLATHPDEAVRGTLDDLPNLLADVEAGAKHIREVALGVRSQARADEESATCDIADVVQFAVRLARAQVRQPTRWVVEGQPTPVACGAVKLTQVFLNLFLNATHAMEGLDRPGRVDISWRVDGGAVIATVRDNGCGIPPELQPKVFEPLFTTKPPGVGTGLGLAICRELMRQMNGEVRLTSEVGVGTVVEVVMKPAPG